MIAERERAFRVDSSRAEKEFLPGGRDFSPGFNKKDRYCVHRSPPSRPPSPPPVSSTRISGETLTRLGPRSAAILPSPSILRGGKESRFFVVGRLVGWLVGWLVWWTDFDTSRRVAKRDRSPKRENRNAQRGKCRRLIKHARAVRATYRY